MASTFAPLVLAASVTAAACGGRPIPARPAPELRQALEIRPLASFPSREAACAEMVRRAFPPPEQGAIVACAPFETQKTCRVLRDERSSATILEVDVVETIPTAHCANDEDAPRADVRSVLVAPASSSGLRVAIESLLDAPSVSTMREGLHDGAIDLESSSKLAERPDAEDVSVFRTESGRCARFFVVCDHARTWCTVPTKVPGDDCGSKLSFSQRDRAVRLTIGGSSGRALAYPFARPER